MIVGYARTSTSEQRAGLEAQVRDLKAAGTKKIFSEQVSSVAQRPKLAECLRFLREGDTLMVTKPDRLARSTHELLKISEELAQAGVGLVIHSMGLDTRNGSNPTAKLMLSVLAAIAQFERDLMLERQREGIARAQAEGKYKGRPQSLDRAAVHRMTADGIRPTTLGGRIAAVARVEAHAVDHQSDAGLCQFLGDLQQLMRRSRQAIRLGHHQRVALAQETQALGELWSLRHGGHLLGEYLFRARRLQIAHLRIEPGALFCGGGASIADDHGPSFRPINPFRIIRTSVR